MSKRTGRLQNFYPRPPRGGRLAGDGVSVRESLISIHALREEGDSARDEMPVRRDAISIHALREEGDTHHLTAGTGEMISIHALREEGDSGDRPFTREELEFLSTPSARRAT